MPNFTEAVKWNDVVVLEDNLVYGLGRPVLENIDVRREGLSILDDTFGRATYQYDFGRFGTVKTLRFTGENLLKFRLKVANSAQGLGTTEFDGTNVDLFPGTFFDTVKYTAVPQAYNIAQSNAIRITGTQTSSGVFVDPAEVRLNPPSLSGTYSVRSSSQLLIGEPLWNSGALSFLRLNDGTNDIQVQKYQAQIRTRIVDNNGNSLGRDVNSNDIILGEPVDISVNSTITDTTSILTDGVFGSIKDVVTDPVAVDEFANLKDVKELTNFFGRTSLGEDCVRILGIRADYSLTGILVDMQEGLFYRPTRINGFYALRVPVVGPKADLFANKITSSNLVNGNYVSAEVNDIWAAKVLVPAGVHYYRFIADGQVQLDVANPNTIEIATGTYSVLTVLSTQFVEFVYHGKAKEVFVTGSFNGFSKTTNSLAVGPDSSEILKIVLGGTYFNSHTDWHKIEIEFKQPTPIIGIRFLTDVPFEHKQRVKIFLDDGPITKDTWEIQCTAEDVVPPGVSECATYSNLLAGNFEGECRSYFANNTDTITASEDGWVEWNFINPPINNRAPHYCKKFTFLTRLENGSVFNRSHRGLEILVPQDFVTRVTDYLVSDNELEFRTTRQTEVGLNSIWYVPQVVLQNGVNVITAMQTLDSVATYGQPVSITRSGPYSFIEQINQSGLSLNNVEVACTLAVDLTHELVAVNNVIDLGGVPSGESHSSQRFTRESFTRANDYLRVVVISIDLDPVQVYFLHLVAEQTRFRLELYETLFDAQHRVNRIGYAESSSYGFQILPIFVQERQVDTPNGPIDVDVSNMIVCFDQYAANTVFETRPRANT
jgi:hypothetical protein